MVAASSDQIVTRERHRRGYRAPCGQDASDAVATGQVDAALHAIRAAIESRAIVGIYLHGSAVVGGLRPDSDIDLFVLAVRRLTRDEKVSLIAGLRPISRRSLRPAGWRPLEVSVVARADVRPWRYPPKLDLQYGEWLDDDDLHAAIERGPISSPDLGVLVEMVRTTAQPLAGPPAGALLDPVPRADLVRAIVDEVPLLLDDLVDDTRNVLLTLARMWCTVETGEIRSKDAAAGWAVERLPDAHRSLLAAARDLYLAGGFGTWDADAVRVTADALVRRIRQAAS